MRFTCDVPGLEQSWIDVADEWTVADARAMHAVRPAEVLAYLRTGGKVLGCRLQTVDADGSEGEPITSIHDLTEEALDTLDVAIVELLGKAIGRAPN